MDFETFNPWHGWREFAKELGTIVLGVLLALGAGQTVAWLGWRHDTEEARQALGREITYNIKALQIMDHESACIGQRLDALSAWASGEGPRPGLPIRMPVTFNLQTSTWDVANSGQIPVHFPLEAQLKYGQLYSRFGNGRDAISAYRTLWAQIVALANQSHPDSEELRRIREAAGVARVWEIRRHANSATMIRTGSPMGVAGPGPSQDTYVNEYTALCAPAARPRAQSPALQK